MRAFVALLALSVAVPIVSAQQPAKPAQEIPKQQTVSAAVSAEDAQALREDVQKMKSLIYQMQRNLASVSTAQDPLKHQFELEIEMWQLEIARLERHLNSSAEKK